MFCVLYFCFLFYVFSVFVLFCALFLLLHIAVCFLFSYKFTDRCHRVETQLQYVYIYIYIYTHTHTYIHFLPADRARWLTQSRYFLTSIRKNSFEDRFFASFLSFGMATQIRPCYVISGHGTWNHARVPHIRPWTCALWSLSTNTPFTVIGTFHAMICNRGSVFKLTTHNDMIAAVSYGSA